mmetsp:Transcript_62277/g.94036  ORF Transcript_62277/g.94036 Transcript_62277/m.94036 type:complete len:225 (-) Transcript_62277:884-1558(-)
MFLPVGSTSGLRMGSPPGPGRMYLPSRASMSAPSSLSATTWRRQNSRYPKSCAMALSSRLKPLSLSARFQGVPPCILSIMPAIGLTCSTRPAELVLRSTSERTAERTASVISWLKLTSSSTPLLLLRYTSSMSRSRLSARRRGSDLTPSSGRSSEAMLTRVAILSSAVGGTPTVCSPHGSRRDSISMRRRYTWPTTSSRWRRSMALASASSAGRSRMSLSRLQL